MDGVMILVRHSCAAACLLLHVARDGDSAQHRHPRNVLQGYMEIMDLHRLLYYVVHMVCLLGCEPLAELLGQKLGVVAFRLRELQD
jgi:hypothetical protein